jgi:UDP-GlcNAc3NAcA epimerase
MKLITIVGARPQFVKAATLSRAIARHNASPSREAIEERIVHTGQHYDSNMSDVFFKELGIPQPAHHLGVGSAPHGMQTGRMLEKIEAILLEEEPDIVIVYGDTNSTLAGALAAAKLHVPIAHVEAGLRSFNREMPEEMNRVIADHLSALLLCPSEQSVKNLRRESIYEGVHRVGDIMFDSVLHYRSQLLARPHALPTLVLAPKAYVLATVHRAENTDSPEKLSGIFEAFAAIAVRYPVVVALHPRTRHFLETHSIDVPASVRILEPVPYLDMIELEVQARLILTDSGGVQKEAFFARTPCLTLREETEWAETIACGANLLCGAVSARILEGFRAFDEARIIPNFTVEPYGEGDAARKIIEVLLAFQKTRMKSHTA